MSERSVGGADRSVAEGCVSGLDGLTGAQVAKLLGLLPHREGGYFRETYRSPIVTPTPAGPRSLCTSILYLLTARDPSRFHRLRFDEVWFFHAGASVEMSLLGPLETHVLCRQAPQAPVPGGRWMAARVAPFGSRPGPDWALVGCVVSPGFDYDDFEGGQQGDLLAAFPEAAELIRALS